MQHRYFLLVILTTSTGADLEEFRAALTGAAGELALSVIVVGIGSIDFAPLKAWPFPPAYPCLEPEQVEGRQQSKPLLKAAVHEGHKGFFLMSRACLAALMAARACAGGCPEQEWQRSPERHVQRT